MNIDSIFLAWELILCYCTYSRHNKNLNFSAKLFKQWGRKSCLLDCTGFQPSNNKFDPSTTYFGGFRKITCFGCVLEFISHKLVEVK